MAAGSSSRMGQPKQILSWKGRTLIEATITKVLRLNTTKTIVVLGANKEKIISKIESYPIEVIYNPNWDRGLGNSIAFGVNYIQNNFKPEAVLIVLADQPLIKNAYLEAMMASFETNKNQIIATQYPNGKLGVPALFDESYLQELSNINGDKGAKAILEKYTNLVMSTQIDTNVFDVDTKEDYKKLLKS